MSIAAHFDAALGVCLGRFNALHNPAVSIAAHFDAALGVCLGRFNALDNPAVFIAAHFDAVLGVCLGRSYASKAPQCLSVDRARACGRGSLGQLGPLCEQAVERTPRALLVSETVANLNLFVFKAAGLGPCSA